jgi:predicted peptidase
MATLQTVTSSPLNYLLSLPEREGKGDRPLLCFLHGYDEGAPMPIGQALTLRGPLQAGNPERIRRDFIIVAPQLPYCGDAWMRFADAVRQIVHSVQEQHGADPARSYLTGFSFGGNGVFDLGSSQPDLWAALWAVDPTRAPSQLQRPVWVSIGEVARSRAPDFVRRLKLQPETDIENDRVYVDRGEDHVGCATAAYGSEEPYAWLLHRRA